MKLPDLIARIRIDLAQIEEAIQWAHNDSYWPTNARPSRRPTGAPTNDHNPDQVPGPPRDFGIGSHRRRQALHASIIELRKAELYIATAGAIAGRWIPRALHHGPLTTTKALDAIARNRQRLDAIGDYERTLRLIRLAERRTDSACRILDSAFAEGEAGDPNEYAAKEPMCKICGIRPRADKTGKRCYTCFTWKNRNGFERPKTIDKDGIAGARQAQRRRRTRGEGWGEA